MARSFTVALFAAALFASVPQIARAQHSVGPRIGGGAPVPSAGVRHGGVGYFGGPGVRLGPLPYPNYSANPTWQLHPNLYPQIKIPHNGNLIHGHSFGHYPYVANSYYPGYFSSGYLPYGYGSSYGYAPSYTYVLPPPGQPAYAPPTTASPAVPEQVAEIQVRVPAAAKVWFNGVESTLGGTNRDFASTPMPPGLVYTYTIRARWTEDGREIDQTRRVPVRAGGNYVVDFTVPEDDAVR